MTMSFRHALFTLTILLAAFGCANEPAEEASTPDAEPVATEAAVTYDLRGVIVDRDEMANTLKVDHEAIGDWMGAMTMSFPVRGADVQELPANGEAITGTIHVDGTEFWLSDVTLATSEEAPADEMATEPADEAPSEE